MATKSKMMYGAEAFKGLCRAVTTIDPFTGCKVTVTAGANPCIAADGTIHMPSLNTWQTEAEFRATCATIYHELCHAKTEHHALFEREVKKHGESNKLFADCLNAVLDCADEMTITRLALRAKNKHVATALHMNHRYHYRLNVRKGAFKSGAAPAHWQILATGIARSRWNMKSNSRLIGEDMIAQFPDVKVREVYRELWGAMMAGWTSGNSYTLVAIAERLEKLLETVRPPDEPVKGMGEPDPTKVGKKRSGGEEAGEEEGVLIVTGAGEEFSAGSGKGTEKAEASAVGDWHKSSYDMLLPVAKWVANRMADDGESMTLATGYSSGSRIRNPARPDGNVFARWQTDPRAEGLAIAITVDKSGSMFAPREFMADGYTPIYWYMDAVLGIADAWADAMTACASVYRLVYADSVYECRRFKGSPLTGGGNAASYGVPESVKLLKKHEGKRVIIVLTDGYPDYPRQCAADYALAKKAGCEILTVALSNPRARKLDEAYLRTSAPHGPIIIADTVEALAIGLKRIAARL